MVTGFAKVEAALGAGQVVALIHAAEAGADGVAKLEAAARRRLGAGETCRSSVALPASNWIWHSAGQM